MTIDLVLSGSSTKLPVFVGALKAFENSLTPVKNIWGTSGGAIIAAMYASGLSASDIEEIVHETKFSKFVSTGFWSIVRAAWRGYLSNGKRLEKFLKIYTANKTFAECEINLHLVATDMTKNEIRVFSKKSDPDMPIWKAARISASLPAAFPAVKYEGSYFSDGGLRKNFAIDMAAKAKTSSSRIFGYLITDDTNVKYQPSILDWLTISIKNLQDAQIVESIDDLFCPHSAKEKVYIIRSSGLDIHTFNFNVSKDTKEKLIEEGYKTTNDFLGSMSVN